MVQCINCVFSSNSLRHVNARGILRSLASASLSKMLTYQGAIPVVKFMLPLRLRSWCCRVPYGHVRSSEFSLSLGTREIDWYLGFNALVTFALSRSWMAASAVFLASTVPLVFQASASRIHQLYTIAHAMKRPLSWQLRRRPLFLALVSRQ